MRIRSEGCSELKPVEDSSEFEVKGSAELGA